MWQILTTPTFDKWLEDLRDDEARTRIVQRVVRLANGNAGDAKPVGRGVSELRIAYGPGYRVYYTRIGEVVLLLLCGGDKSTQKADIAKAYQLAEGGKP